MNRERIRQLCRIIGEALDQIGITLEGSPLAGYFDVDLGRIRTAQREIQHLVQGDRQEAIE